MELQEIYDELDRQHIPIFNVKFDGETKVGIVSNGKKTAICVDYAKFKNSKEEKMALAEEKAHYELGAMYANNCDRVIADKMEYKALKKAYSELIPFSRLKELSKTNSVAEMSDILGVPVKDILMAQFWYENFIGTKEEVAYE